MKSCQIENESVSQLKILLGKGGHVWPSIEQSDKTPCWDGQLIAYSDTTFKKESIIGPVKVQVKGKTSSNLHKNQISYKVKVI